MIYQLSHTINNKIKIMIHRLSHTTNMKIKIRIHPFFHHSKIINWTTFRLISTQAQKTLYKAPLLKKSLGQHLLTSPSILDKIVAAGNIKSTDTVLEIGPGTGKLTSRLLALAQKVEAIEYDHRMINDLPNRVDKELLQNLNIMQGDFARVDIPSFDVCVSNIPYQISSLVVARLMTRPHSYRCAVLLVQEEFGERLIAKPGSKNYSRLTVNTNFLGAAEILFKVGRGNFVPPPKVDSCVIRITPHKDLPNIDIHKWDTMLRIIFQRKNKTLRTLFRLKPSLDQIELQDENVNVTVDKFTYIDEILKELNFHQVRGRTMSLKDFVFLFEQLKTRGITFTPSYTKIFKDLE